MFEIHWTDSQTGDCYQIEKVNNKNEVSSKANDIGSDGAELIWVNDKNGVIIYYNCIIGYVLEPDNEKKHLQDETSLRYTFRTFYEKEDLIKLLIEYSQYVSENAGKNYILKVSEYITKIFHNRYMAKKEKK